MKGKITILLSFIMVFSLLIGSVIVEANTSPVELIIWGGVPAESGPQALVDAWNEENPDIQVEYVRFVNDPTGNTKLDTALLSGEQIDLFFTYSADLLKKRVNSGMIEELEPYGSTEFIEQEIVGNGEGLTYVDGKLYSIPTAREPIGIMINKNMLEDAGLSIPENWTLEDFRDIARKLTKKVNGKIVYGANIYYAESPLSVPQAVLGGNYLYKSETESNFDHPLFESNIFFKEMMDEGIAMPFEEIFSRKLEAYSHPAFLNEEIAMMPFSAWMLRYVKDLENFPHDFQVVFAPFPRPDEDTPNPYQATLNNFIGMNSKSEYKEEAWEFMKYWATEGSIHMLSGGKIPVWKNIASEEVTNGILGADAEELFDVKSYRKVMLNPELKYVVDTIMTAYPQVVQIYKEENQMFFLGATEPEEYLMNLKTRADKVIKSEAK